MNVARAHSHAICPDLVPCTLASNLRHCQRFSSALAGDSTKRTKLRRPDLRTRMRILTTDTELCSKTVAQTLLRLRTSFAMESHRRCCSPCPANRPTELPSFGEISDKKNTYI